MNKNLISIGIGIAFSISLLSMSLIATPYTVSKVYAQNSTGNATTKVNNTTSGMSGILTAKNASSSPSKFIGGAPLNQSASNSSSTSSKTK